MRLNGRIPLTCLALVVLAPVLACAGGFYVPSVGTAASSMGGAYIGLANDYSAVHWNPAGIMSIQGTEVTVSLHDAVLLGSRDGAAYFPVEDSPGGVYDNVERRVAATTATQQNLAPGFFLYADAGPLRGLVSKIGLCGYTIAEYGTEWDGDDVAGDFEQRPVKVNGELPDYKSSIRGYVLSPVIARSFSDRVSVGVSGHFLYGSFEHIRGNWEAVYDSTSTSPDTLVDFYPYEFSEDLTGTGYGATVGVLYEATDLLTVGLTARTPMTVTFEGDVEVTSVLEEYRRASQSESFDLTFPMWAGLGIAYDDFLFDGTVLTADVQWTQWSEVDEIVRSVDTELPDDFGTTTLQWEDTVEFGVGLDYRLSRSTSVRLGYRSIPTPVPDDTFDFVMPMSAKSAFTLGVGYRSDVWRLDVGLEYQSGEKRRLTGTDYMDGKHLDDVMIPSLSFTYGF
ncbi:MAG: hypothetical protein GF400_02420 [Candidatus Eisenbacteria bacterium]|nr:hypothetical protein [Candidatus Eisenbacteria bacterium]